MVFEGLAGNRQADLPALRRHHEPADGPGADEVDPRAGAEQVLAVRFDDRGAGKGDEAGQEIGLGEQIQPEPGGGSLVSDHEVVPGEVPVLGLDRPRVREGKHADRCNDRTDQIGDGVWILRNQMVAAGQPPACRNGHLLPQPLLF